jgi:hypothetical protein
MLQSARLGVQQPNVSSRSHAQTPLWHRMPYEHVSCFESMSGNIKVPKGTCRVSGVLGCSAGRGGFTMRCTTQLVVSAALHCPGVGCDRRASRSIRSRASSASKRVPSAHTVGHHHQSDVFLSCGPSSHTCQPARSLLRRAKVLPPSCRGRHWRKLGSVR